MQNEPLQGAPYLAQTDSPDLSGVSLAQAQFLAQNITMKFASAADLASKLPAATQGMFAFLRDSGRLQWYDGAKWQWYSPRPVYTVQVSAPSFAVLGTFTNFTTAQWPAVTFVVPPSGLFHASISADLSNTNTGTSTIWATWVTTAGSVNVLGAAGLSTAGTRLFATQRVLCSATAGTTVTLTPQWYISSGSSATAQYVNGLLMVEPIA